MKSERNILLAFILNLCFSVFELIGGFFTGSVAILSDALHDLGDAVSIGISYLLERKSKKAPDASHTYGYGRYSVLGGVIIMMILFIGSVAVIVGAINRIFIPTHINYNGMIFLAIIGVLVNLAAVFVTRDEASLNGRAVNLHMLEDVLGWGVVLIGAVVMRFTDLAIIDPIISIGVAIFIIINAARGLIEGVDVFLEKAPHGVDASEIAEYVSKINGVLDVHHIHVWSIDGIHPIATMHAVTKGNLHAVKKDIRHELAEHGISHVTIELESVDEHCRERECSPTYEHTTHHHHNH